LTIEEEIGFWKHYAAVLGQPYTDLFLSAAERPQTAFFDQVILPQLHTGEAYVGIEARTDVPARCDSNAYRIARGGCQPEIWRKNAYFTNPMRVRALGINDTPTQRCVLGQKITFTFEFDRDDVRFLWEQLDWLPHTSNWRGAPIGKLFAKCSKFADFFGITVVYSGNKSLHIHIVFDTGPYRDRHGDVESPAHGLRAHWQALADMAVQTLQPSAADDGKGGTKPMLPDIAMKSPVAYRRLPGGSRILTRANLIGIPPQTRVPQIVLWEKFRQRAVQGAQQLFFSPSMFAIDPMEGKRPAPARSQRLGGTLTPDEHAYCEVKLRSFFPGPDGLILSDFGFDAARNEYCAHFYNGPTDQNPSSVLYESYSRVLLCGSTAGLSSDDRTSLPCSFGTLIQLCCKQLATETALREAASDPDTYWIDEDGDFRFRYDGPDERRIGSEFTFRFANMVVDNETARVVMQKFLPKLIDEEAICLVRGPEGASKTTSIMREHHTIMEGLRQRGSRGLAAYCFADYANAIEKIASFNEFHSGHRYHAVLWPSFTRTYGEVCNALDLTPIGDDEIKKEGYRPLIELIRRKQPAVLVEFQKRHAALWAEIGDREPVIFTVHAVAQQWQQENQSRTMWAKSRWNDDGDMDFDRSTLVDETSLALLVHDEVKWSTFADAINGPTFAWLQALPPNVGTALRNGQTSKFRALLDKHVAKQHWPDDTAMLPTDVARYLAAEDWSEVTLSDTAEYLSRPCDDPEQDIYAKCFGKVWHVRARAWWTHGRRQIADRIVFLTTETVPTAVAEKAHPGIYIVELNAERMQRDSIETWSMRGVTINSLDALCAEHLKTLSAATGTDWVGISNKTTIDDVMTHAKARGANGLIGSNVLQTCTFMAPGDFELHQALNAWTGSRVLVSGRHIDEINQSAGRNLGFRRREGVRHVLLINRRLYDTLLATNAFAGLRYDLSIHADNDDRKYAKKASASPASTIA
jgi:hypothetical protein